MPAPWKTKAALSVLVMSIVVEPKLIVRLVGSEIVQPLKAPVRSRVHVPVPPFITRVAADDVDAKFPQISPALAAVKVPY